MDMERIVGETAGKIYRAYLPSREPIEASAIARVLNINNKPLLFMAIGWLAREGKARVEKDGGKVLIRITP